jgi:hypothetical protein
MSDLVVKLIVLAAVAAGLLMVAYGVVNHFEARGRAKEAAEWAPKLAAAQAATLTAKAEAEGARADLASLRADYQAQGEAVARLAAESKAKADQVKKLLADIAKNSRQFQAEIDRLQGIATGPVTPAEGNCENADHVLRALFVERLRVTP